MKYLTNYVPQGTGGMSAGYVVVEDNGVLKAQKLTFDGTTPQFDGVAEEITDVGIFESGLDEPAYNGSGGGGTAKYYKCDSVDTANKTWSGYELVLQDGVYVVSDTLTEDFAYTGFKPVVGKVYSEDGFIEVKDYYTGVVLVSPTSMTSNENDEWLIDSSGILHDGVQPYMAFSGYDAAPEGWYSEGYSSLPQWIRWQNKTSKVKITSYSMRVGTNNPTEAERRFPGTWELQGSDDGSSWTVVDRREKHGSVTNGTTYSFECQNPESYYYYRIYVTESAVPGESFAAIAQIKAYGQFV